MDALQSHAIFDLLKHYDAPAASREQLERVHAATYLDSLEARRPAEGFERIDPDTCMSAGTLTAATHAAGAAVLATDLVLDGEVENAFCCVRPPGHHAGPDFAMGFCFFNSVAVAAAHALARGVERVAILDFDVHHGNGTEAIFENDERVLLCSAFQHPFYPFTGSESEPGHIVNVPLAAGTAGDGFRQAVDRHWTPAIERFSPDLIVVSAGFDGHALDPLAGLALTEDDYGWISERIVGFADTCADGRVISCLEGGYALHPLGVCVTRHIRTLARI